MRQPKSELPWIGEDFDDLKSHNNTNYICDSGYNNIFCEPEDFQYLKEACNNYPKAIELLKLCSLYIDNVKNVSIDNVQPKLDEFLKQIENEINL